RQGRECPVYRTGMGCGSHHRSTGRRIGGIWCPQPATAARWTCRGGGARPILRVMTNRTDEEHDFDLVDEYIRSPAGILLERIKPVPGKAKRPDFEVLSPHGRADLGDLAAYLEFKSLWDDHFDTLVENAPEGGIVGYSGRDP